MTSLLSSKIEAINVVLSDPGIGMAISQHRQEGYRVMYFTVQARGEFGEPATVHELTMNAEEVELCAARHLARAIALEVIRQINEQQRGSPAQKIKRRVKAELQLRRA